LGSLVGANCSWFGCVIVRWLVYVVDASFPQ
jgi:hypothetical protein